MQMVIIGGRIQIVAEMMGFGGVTALLLLGGGLLMEVECFGGAE